jgi:hypothetical protein
MRESIVFCPHCDKMINLLIDGEAFISLRNPKGCFRQQYKECGYRAEQLEKMFIECCYVGQGCKFEEKFKKEGRI